MDLFGRQFSRDEIDALCPDITRLAGIRQFREDNGPGSGQRVIRIESGGGLGIELLPDRTCDIGQVWCNGTPFGWIGPIGTPDPSRLRGNQPLSGLMSTCGFDHIRQPEEEGGTQFPQHGSMMHQASTIVAAGPVWEEENCVFRVVAECTQFALDRGGMRLCRTIDVPLGGQSLTLVDEVTVLIKPQPLMAMYHINLGYPLAEPESHLVLDGADLTGECLAQDGVLTRAAGNGRVTTSLSSPRTGAQFSVTFDADQLPVFQTLRNSTPGINLVCLEPATHERRTRAELRRDSALQPASVGAKKRFEIGMHFTPAS
ncbi:DUF4432 family protein [Pelagibacterium halotolerans]|nr:DUF4432 family protein [Pelagibacterium halotolerans]